MYTGAACVLGFTAPRKLSPDYWKVTAVLEKKVSSGSVVIAGGSSHTAYMVTTLPPIKTFAHFQEKKKKKTKPFLHLQGMQGLKI